MTIQALRYHEVPSDRTAQSLVGNSLGELDEIEAYLVGDGEYFVERYLEGTYTYGAINEADADNLHWYLAERRHIMGLLDAINLTGEIPSILHKDHAGPVNAIVLKSSEGHEHPQNQWYEWVNLGGKRALWMNPSAAKEWLHEHGKEETYAYDLVPAHSFIRAPVLSGTLHKLQGTP